MKKFIFVISLLALFAYLPICEGGQTAVTKAYSDNVRRADGKISSAVSLPDFDIPSDNEADLHSVNKLGNADSGVQATATDIWDLADATPTQQIWVAPTSAQTHWIVSSSTSDTSAGVGARTVRLKGLIAWDLPEIWEDIVMNGQTSVTTTQSYVTINSMEVLTKGATNVNVGAISAFATSDLTTTQRILAGEGETHSAIYAISSLDYAFITQFYGDIISQTGSIKYSLQVNPEPDTELLNYVTVKKRSVVAVGSSSKSWLFKPYLKVSGPAIIKMSGIANVADMDGGAGFDLIRWTDTSGFDAIITSNSSKKLDSRIITTSDGRIIRTSQDITN